MSEYSNIINPLLVVKKGNPLPTNEVCYGPYDSVESALEDMTNTFGEIIPEGLTCCIKEENSLQEYWYQKEKGLIKKSSNITIE